MKMKKVITLFLLATSTAILVVINVIFSKVMEGINNSVGALRNNIAHKDRSDLDSRP